MDDLEESAWSPKTVFLAVVLFVFCVAIDVMVALPIFLATGVVLSLVFGLSGQPLLLTSIFVSIIGAAVVLWVIGKSTVTCLTRRSEKQRRHLKRYDK